MKLYPYADEVLERERLENTKNPMRRVSAVYKILSDVRAGDYAAAGKRIAKSTNLYGHVSDGKLVITDQRGRALGYLEVDRNTWPVKFGSRGWAMEAGRRMQQ